MKTPNVPTFQEIQSLKIMAVRVILGIVTVIAIASFSWILYREGWGKEVLVGGLPMLLIMALLWWVMEASRLYTHFSAEGIAYRFYPLQFKDRFVPWNDLQEVYLREYSALGEYGGWGLRWGFGSGLGYIAGGNWGLQLVYKEGKKRFISTQKPNELKQWLAQYAPATATG